MKLKLFSFTILSFCLALVSGAKAVEAASLTTIVDGVSNARGVSFGPDGTLYVAEPGVGGNGNCQPSPSTLFQPICAGNTGSIVKVTPDGNQERIFTNFESLAEQPSGNQGAGLQDIQFDSKGDAYVLTGFAGYPGNRDLETLELGSNYPLSPQQYAVFPPSSPEEVLNSPDLAKLYKADLLTGQLTPVFDFAKYEITNNPDGGDAVTNPYDLTINGDTAYVVDGGGNAAYSIKLDGSESKAIGIPKLIVTNPELPPLPEGPAENSEAQGQQAIGQGAPDAGATSEGQPPQGETPGGLPPGLINPVPGRPDQIEIQAVPTGGAIGPDGALYVGEYTGFPYPEGEAKILRIGEDGVPQVFADGFTHITELTFDKNGNMLVLQFSDQAQWKGDIRDLPGSLIQVAPDGTRTTLVAAGEGLESADGIAIGPDNQIYITDRGVGPGLGKVVRVDGLAGAEPVPEPSSVLGVLAVGGLGVGSWLQRKRKAQTKSLN